MNNQSSPNSLVRQKMKVKSRSHPVSASYDSRHVDIREIDEFWSHPPVITRKGVSSKTLAALALSRVERLTLTAKLFENNPDSVEIKDVATLFAAPLEEIEQLISAVLADPGLRPDKRISA